MSTTPKTETEWHKAADDAYDHLAARRDHYDLGQMLSFIDDLVVLGATDRDALEQKYPNRDFVGTTLGHVTTAVHGGDKVPEDGGWYARPAPDRYEVHPQFAAAWRRKRGLSAD